MIDAKKNNQRPNRIRILETALGKAETEIESLKSALIEYETVYDTLPDSILVLDRNGIVLRCNKEFPLATGIYESRIVGKRIFDLEFLRINAAGLFKKLLSHEKTHSDVFKTTANWSNDDGTVREGTANIRIIRKKGAVTGYAVVIHNITDRENAEKELIETRILLNETQRLSKTGGWEYDVVHKTVKWTDGIYLIFGVEKDFDLNNLDNHFPFFHPDDRPALNEAFRKAVSEGIPFDLQLRFTNKQGKNLWVRDIAKPEFENGRISRIVGHFQDITGNVKILKELSESEEKYRNLVEKARIAISVENREGEITYSNRVHAELYGYSVSELLNMNRKDLVHPEDYKIVKDAQKKMFKGQKVCRYEFKGITKNKETVFLEVDGDVVRSGKEFIGVRNYFWDISARKKREMAVKESEKWYRELFHHLHVGIAVFSPQKGRKGFLLKSMNDFGREILDISDSKIGEKPDSVYNNFNTSHLKRAMKTVGNTSKSKNIILYKSQKNDIVKWVQNHVFRLSYDDIGIIFEDLTQSKQAEKERKTLEDQLFQAQKMESIGRLAGGIAHDFNNILTGIMGQAELLKLKLNRDKVQENHSLKVILECADRAAAVVKQLFYISSKEFNVQETVDVRSILESTLLITELVFEKRIKVKKFFRKNTKNIRADKNLLGQVFSNLFINAADAMARGGSLYLRAENISLPEKLLVKTANIPPGEYVQITVRDTGCGIPDDLKERIFEPFVSTKKDTVGIGLGLSVVYGIIKNQKGHILVDSEKGTGTKITVLFPATDDPVIAKKEDYLLYDGTESILIVDDEEYVQTVVRKMLENFGYRVYSAKNGPVALKIFKNMKNEIDLVLLDLIMPGMTGQEVFRKMKKIRPDVKILIMSGFSAGMKAQDILQEGALGYIQKPFKMADFSRLIHRTLKL